MSFNHFVQKLKKNGPNNNVYQENYTQAIQILQPKNSTTMATSNLIYNEEEREEVRETKWKQSSKSDYALWMPHASNF